MNFEEMSINDLKQLAKDKGLKNISKLKKNELIEMLKEDDSNNEEIKRMDNLQNN